MKMWLQDKNNDLSFLRGTLFLPCFVFVEKQLFLNHSINNKKINPFSEVSNHAFLILVRKSPGKEEDEESYLMFTRKSLGKSWNPHFRDKETDFWEGAVTFPVSISMNIKELRFEPKVAWLNDAQSL